MKKRIISLILVAVISVLALAGCGYSYEKDNMDNYATFNKDAFLAALADGSIKITDADFGVDADRDLLVLDAIMSTVAKSAGTDNKVKEGVAGKYDMLYYCYYATAVIENEIRTFYANKMAESSPTSFQMGLTTVEGLQEKIQALFATTDVASHIYTTVTVDDTATKDVVENKVAAGNVVYVSYTRDYTAYLFDKDGNPVIDEETQTQEKGTEQDKVAYKKVTVSDDTATFLGQLAGKTVGSTSSFEVVEALGFETAEENTVKYSDVKIHWIVKNESEIGTVTDTPYTKEQKEKDADGKEWDLKDVELTYHIFPVYLIGVGNEPTAEIVLEYFYNTVVATEEHSEDEEAEEGEEHEHPYVFDSLENGNYKNGEKTLAELVKELVTLRSELATAKKAKDDAKSTYDKNPTTDNSTKLTEAEGKVTEAEGKVSAKVTEILGCTNEAGGDVKADLVKDLKAYQYDTLEKTYKNAIKQSLAKEIYALATSDTYIKFKTDGDKPVLPKKAVREAYKRIENNHKYDFYEGKFESTNSNSSESNYHHYNGIYENYLIAVYAKKDSSVDTVEKAHAKMQAEAEQSVRDIITVYILADFFKDQKDLSVTDKQVDDFKLTYIWYVYGSLMTENDYKTALLFDNVMNYILEENEEADGVKVDYLRVKYDFKAEEEETEESSGQ